ncbi:MAG TPA: oligopeptide/dipeptide ABC transporter ATP-binding protein, partial [Clostridia bacterium]|nr:oligopeptide/dipeptide ABC transporter ATP-binding protein [Clostridia bacterium]
ETAVLYAGKIIEYGRAKKLIVTPKHPYTRGLLRSFPNMTTTKDLQGIRGKMARSLEGCVFHQRCTQAVDICYHTEPPLERSNGRFLACHRGGIIPVLKIENLCKSFGGNEVVKDVTLTVDEGETLGLVGESGSGKSTLAHSIMGIFKTDRGKVFIDEEEVKTRDKAFYKTIQIVFQNPTESINHRLSVLEAIMEPLEIQGIGNTDERKEKAVQALLDVELPVNDEFLHRYAHHLSGGETQRVAIARALVLEPRFIIADEPTSSLDASTQAKVLKLLMKLQEEKGLSLLLITHDIALARKVCDRIAVLHKGRIIEEGASHNLIAQPAHPYTKKLISAAPFF